PDIILIGEIRDHETAQIAVEASLTGHLVLTTLHTNDAASVVTRLTEMGIEPFLIGSALECATGQRLARRLCAKCRRPSEMSSDDLMAVNFEPTPGHAPTIYEAVGCSSCANTGYRGRLAIHEIMPMSEQIERLTSSRASSEEIKRMAIEQGMRTLRQDGWRNVSEGSTTITEVLRVTG
ncbi:MAG: ATPase, T2SS/T4P/T4SS family, partial [Actinomycetes bacterium]